MIIKSLGVIAFIVVLGLVGHQDQTDQQALAESDMITICQHSYQVIDGALEQECGERIDKIQSDGQHEVLSKDGRFWVEHKGDK
jgi:hypothetical protein